MVPTFHRPRLLAAALLLAASAVALCAAALLAPAAATAAPTPFPVSIAMGGQAGPDISGSIVVWTDFRNGNADIYGRNLSTGKDLVVVKADGSQDNPSVDRAVVDGNVSYIAVWVDSRYHAGGEARDILARNITTGKNFTVIKNARIKWFPKIDDQWVVWVEADDAAGPYYIKARDLVSGTVTRVATSKVLSTVGLSRRLVAGKAVYTAVYAAGEGDIMARNLPGGTPFAISRSTRFEWMPDISGRRVVWWQGGGRVMLYDIATKTPSLVHLGARPRIYGQTVVWDDGGSGGKFTTTYTAGADIWVRDLATGATTRISQPNLTCLFPAVSTGTVVWESGPAARVLSHTHIYGARVR